MILRIPRQCHVHVTIYLLCLMFCYLHAMVHILHTLCHVLYSIYSRFNAPYLTLYLLRYVLCVSFIWSVHGVLCILDQLLTSTMPYPLHPRHAVSHSDIRYDTLHVICSICQAPVLYTLCHAITQHRRSHIQLYSAT